MASYENNEENRVFSQPEDNNMPIGASIADDDFTAPDIDVSLPNEALSDFSPDEEDAEGDDGEYQESISDIDEELSVALQKSTVPTEVTIPTDEDDEPLPSKKAAKSDEKQEKIRPIDNHFDFLELFVFTLVCVLLLTTFVFRHSIVDGGSMESTLYDGEHLIISDLFYTPERGDIIVFQDYSKGEYDKNLKAPLVKRIIAVGGDTVRVTVNGEVYVNGELLDESYTYYSEGAKHLGSYFSGNAPDFTYFPSHAAPEYI